jgi:hypothetical protein
MKIYPLEVPVKKILLAVALSLGLVSGCAQKEDFSQIRGAVHELKFQNPDKKLVGFCSGVAITPTFMMTAAHCDLGQPIYVNGYRAFIVKKDPARDLMALHIPMGVNCPCVPDVRPEPERDTKVYTVGFPLDAGQVLTEGRWQSVNSKGDMLFTSPIIYGNSGGGVFLHNGKSWSLVGIVSRGTVIPLGGFVPALIGHLNYGAGGASILEFIIGE